jgi:hypothetical protein
VIELSALPSPTAIKSAIEYHGEASVRRTLTTLFHRLHASRKLQRPDGGYFQDVATAIDLVCPAPVNPGDPMVFNEPIYAAIVAKSSADKDDPEAPIGAQPIKQEHWPQLQPVLLEAADVAAHCTGASKEIEAVFGPGADVSGLAGSFKTVSSRLRGFSEKNFVVNYSSSDDITGAAGAARPNSGIIELSGSLVKEITGKKNTAIATLIHEAAHETNAAIIDLGYAGSAGFENMTVKDKLCNADHYAEVAMRVLGTSSYQSVTFVPKSGILAGTERRDLFIKRVKAANDGLAKLWTFSLGVVETMIPRLVPGIDPGTGQPRGRKDTQQEIDDKKKLAAGIKSAYELPGGPFVFTEVDYKLVQTAVMVLSRSMNKLKRIAKTSDPAVIDKLITYTDAFDLASAAIRNVGGFSADRNESDASHLGIASLYLNFNHTSAYPT